jgi:hypothetical protein
MPLSENTPYWIARGQQMFGPYTAAQVREYVQSGNIVPTDMIRGESDAEWIPVGSALGLATPPSPPSPPGGAGYGSPYGYPSNQPHGGAYPTTSAPHDPSRSFALWSIGLGLFGFFCCSCASPVGLVLGVIALTKARPESRGLAWAGIIIGIVALLVNIGMAILFAARPELNPLNDLLKNFPQ